MLCLRWLVNDYQWNCSALRNILCWVTGRDAQVGYKYSTAFYIPGMWLHDRSKMHKGDGKKHITQTSAYFKCFPSWTGLRQLSQDQGSWQREDFTAQPGCTRMQTSPGHGWGTCHWAIGTVGVESSLLNHTELGKMYTSGKIYFCLT